MNWMINIFFLLFLTSLTGMFMQLVWLAAAKLCGHKNPVAIYIGLWFVCLSYLIPVIYILASMHFKSSFYSIHDNDHSHIMERVFPITLPLARNVVFIIGIIWVIASLGFFFYHLYQFWGRMKFRKSCYLETNKEVLEKLTECQKRLSLKKVPKVYRSLELSGPLCIGTFSKAIIMPEKEYLPEELDVIFMHELTHIKYHDLELKFLSLVVAIIHCCNIPAHFLFRQISVWTEIKCDILTCRESKELFNTKKYYSTIINIMGNSGNKTIKKFFITALAEKKSELTKRMIYVNQYKKAGKGIRNATISVVITAFLVGSTVSFAAGTMSLNCYDKFVSNNFIVEEKKMVQEKKFEEVTENVDKIWNLVNVTDSLASTEEVNSYDWTIDSMDTYLTQKVYFKEGSEIKIRCSSVENIDNNIVIGIIDSNNTARSVEDIQAVAYDFEIEESGYYSVFVQNSNASAMDVAFTYHVL